MEQATKGTADLICEERQKDKFFPEYFRCGWCDNCIEYARRKLKQRFLKADFDYHIILTVLPKADSYDFETKSYKEMMYMIDGFKKELQKRLKTQWEFWAIPHVEYKKQQNEWHPHVHALFRGIDEADVEHMKKAWRKTRGWKHGDGDNAPYTEGAMVIAKPQENHRQKENAAAYVAWKFRLVRLGKREQLYRKTAGFYKKKKVGGQKSVVHHHKRKALLGVIRAYRQLLKPGEKKRLQMADLKKKLRQKQQGRLWGAHGHVAQLIEMGFIGRETDPERKNGYLYWLKPETEYSEELWEILG